VAEETVARTPVGDGPYEVTYLNGFVEEVPDLETARTRVTRPESRPPDAPQDQIATYRLKVE
jgi:hypothetical protein